MLDPKYVNWPKLFSLPKKRVQINYNHITYKNLINNLVENDIVNPWLVSSCSFFYLRGLESFIEFQRFLYNKGFSFF